MNGSIKRIDPTPSKHNLSGTQSTRGYPKIHQTIKYEMNK